MAPKKAQKPEPKASKKAASEKPETSKQKKTDVDPPKTQAKKRSAPESVEEAGPVYQPETSALEKKRLHAAEELRRVEQQVCQQYSRHLDDHARPPLHGNPIPRALNYAPLMAVQIFDLETKYLDSSSAFGNAVRGEMFFY